MNIADTKKALLTAQRAYDRAMRAKTCGEAANNLRLGQKQEQRAREALTQMQYERAAAEDRARSEGAADRSRERQYRKRPKRTSRP